MRWYAAQVVPGHEFIAEGHLLRQRFCVDVLAERLSKRTFFGRDRKPVFAGYVFLKFDVDGAFRWEAVSGTVGVLGLLPRHAQLPLPLPAGFVERVQADLTGGAWRGEESVAAVARDYLPGERVPIERGPYADHVGKLDRYHKGNAWVILSLLGRKIAVPIPPSNLAPAPPLATLSGAVAS